MDGSNKAHIDRVGKYNDIRVEMENLMVVLSSDGFKWKKAELIGYSQRAIL